MFNLRKLHHKANTSFRIDQSGECKVICGSGPISVKVFRSIADTINSTVTGCTTHVHIAQLYQNVIGNTNELRRIGIQLNQILLSLINRGKYCSCLIGMHRNIMGSVSCNCFSFYGSRSMIKQRITCKVIFRSARGIFNSGHTCVYSRRGINADTGYAGTFSSRDRL